LGRKSDKAQEMITTPHPAPTGRRRKARREAATIAWQTDLPADWRDMVVVPLALTTYRDYEMAAERVVGIDEDDRPCYCASRFIVADTRSDDDEEFYQVAVYAEALSAWRLRDGRWLIYRYITCDGERGSGFYSFGEHMPR
jgi:hypothetical protein